MILRQLKDQICLKPLTTITNGVALNVPSSSLTTVLTLNAISNHKISRISCSGDCYSKYQLFIDNNLIETKISAPNYSIDFNFINELSLNIGQILDIKVTHFFTSELANYESTIYSRV